MTSIIELDDFLEFNNDWRDLLLNVKCYQDYLKFLTKGKCLTWFPSINQPKQSEWSDWSMLSNHRELLLLSTPRITTAPPPRYGIPKSTRLMGTGP